MRACVAWAACCWCWWWWGGAACVGGAGGAPDTNVWKLELTLSWRRQLPPQVEYARGSELRLRCEVVLNVTRAERHSRERNTSQRLAPGDVPARHLAALAGGVRVAWLRGAGAGPSTELAPGGRVSLRRNASDAAVSSQLRLRNVQPADEDSYTCAFSGAASERRSTTRLRVVEEEAEVELPTYGSPFPQTMRTDFDVASVGDMMTDPTTATKPTTPKHYDPICQKYVGMQCSKFLKGEFVYIPPDTTQAELEDKLTTAFQVTRYSNDISSNCAGYTVPSLCYSTFPICRNPQLTNDVFLKEVKSFGVTTENEVANRQEVDEEPRIVIENLPSGGLPARLDPNRTKPNISVESTAFTSVKSIAQKFNYRYSSTVLRRVCKEDCEILENELCQKEYVIAKMHPHIGQQLTLEDCQDLPENDVECLKIGIGAVIVSDDNCYWENGVSYLGIVDTSSNGEACIVWSKQLYIRLADYPELSGRHSYCRNPGGMESQPWCFIEKDGKTVKQVCDIPKCAHKIWIYIIIVFVMLTCLFMTLMLCVCCRSKNKATTIRDINLPNADKNIYGNSRLNSPMELNDLLLNQNLHNPANPSRNLRGNGVLRVPQYTLSQIKFLEELGEGAFGKVYKGALSKGGDTTYVAVKALKENASAKTKADFRREIDLISELRHENIVCIVGVALREEPLCMLFEFMARGDLHEFLMGRAPPSGKGLPPQRLLNIAYHIASGMQYLAAHHYVHRDLAARNCLVADDFVVKISDFGLSRDIYSSDYYRVQSKSLLPVRWMPPESILYGKFTTESDIWSYGVVLWEIYSFGLQPYYGYSNQEVISMVRGGELLACPAGCPPAIYSLMRDCWKHTPQRRPHFEDIADRFQGWIQMGGCGDGGSSESSSSTHRPALSIGDPRERIPLLPAHCSSSNGSLATGSVRKLSVAGSIARMPDDNCSTCSEIPPTVSKFKKGSCGSLIDSGSDKTGVRDTVVRLHTNGQANDI